MDQLLDSFLAYITVEKGLSKNTLESYGRDVRKFLSFLEKNKVNSVHEIKYENILDFLSSFKKQGFSDTTTVRTIVSIKQFFKYLLIEKIITEDPSAQIHTPKMKKSIPGVISLEDVEKILSAPDESTLEGLRDLAMLEVLYAFSFHLFYYLYLYLAVSQSCRKSSLLNSGLYFFDELTIDKQCE